MAVHKQKLLTVHNKGAIAIVCVMQKLWLLRYWPKREQICSTVFLINGLWTADLLKIYESPLHDIWIGYYLWITSEKVCVWGKIQKGYSKHSDRVCVLIEIIMHVNDVTFYVKLHFLCKLHFLLFGVPIFESKATNFKIPKLMKALSFLECYIHFTLNDSKCLGMFLKYYLVLSVF